MVSKTLSIRVAHEASSGRARSVYHANRDDCWPCDGYRDCRHPRRIAATQPGADGPWPGFDGWRAGHWRRALVGWRPDGRRTMVGRRAVAAPPADERRHAAAPRQHLPRAAAASAADGAAQWRPLEQWRRTMVRRQQRRPLVRGKQWRPLVGRRQQRGALVRWWPLVGRDERAGRVERL